MSLYAAHVVTYTPSVEIKASEWFSTTVAGKKCFVYDNEVAPFTYFDTDGGVVMEIYSKREVKWMEIKPKSLGLTYTYSGNNIRIKIDKPCQFSVEINNMPYKEPLLVFANSIEKSKPSKKDTNIVFFEEGKIYQAGKIALKSGKTIYIEGGAVVQGCINIYNAQNIKILGRGILDGVNNWEYNKNEWHHFLEFKDCKNVTLSGINLIRARTWEVVSLHSQNVLVDNIHIVSEYGSDDGIDIVHTQNMTIKNSFIRSKDDNIVVKCSGEYSRTESTKDIHVENCVLWNTTFGNSIEIGFELQADTIKNIRFTNCDVIHCESGAVFSIHNTDFAVVKDVVFENIRVEEAKQKLFDLSIFLSRYSKDNIFSDKETNERYWHGVWDNAILLSKDEQQKFSKNRGKIENIVFRNIYLNDTQLPFSVLEGFDEAHKVQKIIFENIIYNGRKLNSGSQGRFISKFADSFVFK